MRPRKSEMTARAAAAGSLLLNTWTVPAAQADDIAESDTRPRVIISSDFPPLDVIPVRGVKAGDPPERCSDPDDVQSMVRFLLYTNELEVEALIASAGTFANIARKQNIISILDVYGQVDENLQRHDPRYPDANALRAITWQGLDGAWGTPDFGVTNRSLDNMLGEGKDTEASDAIIRIVDEPDPRPVWFCAWGGSREMAQAIWKVRASRSPAELCRFLGKVRLYLIGRQDLTTQWLLDTFPDLFVILSRKNYTGMFWNTAGADQEIANLAWVNANIREGHGPLGAVYPKSGWDPAVPGVWEGDTPSFLHLVSGERGLNDPEHPDQGGWGGRFLQPDPARKHWFDDKAGTRAVTRWRGHLQDEFARRIQWTLDSDPADDNRRPVAVLNGDTSHQPVRLSVRSGEMVTLSSEGSHDPDGDAIETSWWIEARADAAPGATLSTRTGPVTRLILADGATLQSVHVLLQIRDNGTPNLWAYRRAIIHVEP